MDSTLPDFTHRVNTYIAYIVYSSCIIAPRDLNWLSTDRCSVSIKHNTVHFPHLFQSHSNNEAHWDGVCGLPLEQRQAYMFQALTDPDEEAILDGMMDLNTGTWSS